MRIYFERCSVFSRVFPSIPDFLKTAATRFATSTREFQVKVGEVSETKKLVCFLTPLRRSLLRYRIYSKAQNIINIYIGFSTPWFKMD